MQMGFLSQAFPLGTTLLYSPSGYHDQWLGETSVMVLDVSARDWLSCGPMWPSYVSSSFTTHLEVPFCWTPTVEPCLWLWEGFTFMKSELETFGIRNHRLTWVSVGGRQLA